MLTLDTDLTYVKGIGPQRAQLLAKELDLHTVSDLLHYYPTHYVDVSRIWHISDFCGEMPYVQIRGHFVSLTVQGEGAKSRLVGLFTDGTATMSVVWWQRIAWHKDKYLTGTEYVLFGRPTEWNDRWQLSHPEIDMPSTTRASMGMRPVYGLTEKLRNRSINSRHISGWVANILGAIKPLEEMLPPAVMAERGLMGRDQAVRVLHQPADPAQLQEARRRMKYEELLVLQLHVQHLGLVRRHDSQGYIFPRVGENFNNFYNNCLPFTLTGAQQRVVREIRADMLTGRQMNRLLQGDVGSGKTLVALLSMLIAIDNDTQACMMAPTEILATQHYETLTEMLRGTDVRVALLKGSVSKAKRRPMLEALRKGEIDILVGTHAVLEDPVQFARLGMVVIDEQHRFGVAQRARLWRKGAERLPHVLVMTATPIPRTLAMTVYGDLDVSVIDELPPGRHPISTCLRFDNQRLKVYQGIYQEIKRGRQVYIVYPLIDENEKLSLRSLEEGYDSVREAFPECRVAYVHGRMKADEKAFQMQQFVDHKADILVATTVIEVGVNVPNATIMVIENAERFGLSQLHQLRGRVGRGAQQSYCILMSKPQIGRDTRERLTLMTQTTDGFQIAEADMRQRGPGDLEGTMQSGIPFDLKVANLSTDSALVALTRDDAVHMLQKDPALTLPEHARLCQAVAKAFPRQVDWSQIS